MKTKYLIAQLLLTQAQFADIQMPEREGGKTLKLKIEKKGSYKDLVTDKIMKSHFVQQATIPPNTDGDDDNMNHNMENGATIVDRTPTHPVGPEKKQNPTIDIDDYNSLTYFSEFSLGSDKQNVRLAFSTASPVSVVNSQNCEGCDKSSYGYEY